MEKKNRRPATMHAFGFRPADYGGVFCICRTRMSTRLESYFEEEGLYTNITFEMTLVDVGKQYGAIFRDLSNSNNCCTFALRN